jgi:hypothetical protein
VRVRVFCLDVKSSVAISEEHRLSVGEHDAEENVAQNYPGSRPDF